MINSLVRTCSRTQMNNMNLYSSVEILIRTFLFKNESYDSSKIFLIQTFKFKDFEILDSLELALKLLIFKLRLVY